MLIVTVLCYFKLTTEIKLHSRHFLKHFDLFTALRRFPLEHVAVVGFWWRGEFRQRRTAAAVCRTELQTSQTLWINIRHLSWYNTAICLGLQCAGLTFVSVVQHLIGGVRAAVMWAGWACGRGAGRQTRAATGASRHRWRLSVYTATAALLGTKRSPSPVRNLQRLRDSQRETLNNHAFHTTGG